MDLIERPTDEVRRHPWEIARARFFLRLVERLAVVEGTASWLDVGAGDAWFAHQLRAVIPDAARLVCWDVNYSPSQLEAASAADGGVVLTQARPSGAFDGVLMLDVIEHVEDDIGFVRAVVRDLVAVGGWVLVSVPAYQGLFSEHDRALKHFRRYSPRGLRSVLEAAGLTIEARGGLFHALLPVRGAQVLRERHRGPAPEQTGIGAWQGDDRVSRVVTALLDGEARLSLAMGTRQLPVVPGLSTWAFCRRRAEDVS
jgi:hypothetical protein